jgi:beta-lactamase regulating signal transducer with metallopeptidase domain
MVLVKLVLPPGLALPISVGYWVPRTADAWGGRGAVSSEWMVREGESRADVGGAVGGLDIVGGLGRPVAGVTWVSFAAAVGWLGMGAMVVGMAWTAFRLRRVVEASELAIGEWSTEAAACASNLGLRKVPEVRFTNALATPAVCGLVRAVILVPRSLADRLGDEARRDVLLHEMAHVRRGDLWLGTIELGLLAVYWWHPLVWLARSRMRQVREEIADAVVVVDGRRDAGRYAETLLQVARSSVRNPWLAVGLAGIQEGKGILKRRVAALLMGNGVPVPRLGRLCGSLVVAGGVGLLPMAGGVSLSEAASGGAAWERGPGIGAPAEPTGVGEAKADQLPDASRIPIETTQTPNQTIPSEPPQMVTRSYKVSFKALIPGLETMLGRSVEDSQAAWTSALRQVLEAAGARFDPPRAIYLNIRTGLLLVRAEAVVMDVVDRVLEVTSRQPPLVQLEARLVRVTHPGLVRLMSMNEDAAEVLDANTLQRLWAEVVKLEPQAHRLEGPRVTTLAGREASVEQGSPEGGPSLKLEVTPDATVDDGRLTLRLGVRYRPGFAERTGAGVEGEYGGSRVVTLRSRDTVAWRLGRVDKPKGTAGAEDSSGRWVVLVTASFIDPAGNIIP